MPVVVNAAAGVAPLNIAKKPLNASVTTAPNILYILDDSGSMESDYLPDWAGSALCRTASGTNFQQSCTGTSSSNSMPPFRSSSFNSIYYNPEIRYTPAKNADGTSKPEQTSWTAVKDDAYGIQSTNVTNLVTNYTDTEWCTTSAFTDCLRNDNYILPGTVNAKNYTIAHKVPAFVATSGTVATGSRAAPTTATKTFGPHYYNINPGEYCDSAALTKCQELPTTTYAIGAKVRWCTNETNAVKPPAATGVVDGCQATRDSGHKAARYPTKFLKTTTGATIVNTEVLWVAGTAQVGTAAVAAVAPKAAVGASVTFSVVLGTDCEGSVKARVSKVNVNGSNILPNQTSRTLDANTLASEIRSGINSASSPPYVASGSGTSIKLQAPATAGNITYSVAITLSSGSCSVTLNPVAPKFAGYTAATTGSPFVPASPDYQPATAATCGSPVTLSGIPTPPGTNSFGHSNGQKVCQTTTTGTTTQYYGSFSRVDIVDGFTYPKAVTRTDCSDTGCTYAQEMTNFANWWTYYRTRLQSMKTSTSLAFAAVDGTKRVGFSTISDTTAANSATFLNISDFSPAQKSVWYTTLFNTKTEGNTPLRTALSQAGRIYANKVGTDPVQYSCQTNFALLTTDGYWNGGGGVDIGGSAMGNLDSRSIVPAVPTPKREGTAAAVGTLADVAKYYYDTDLRTPALGNCTGALGGGINVCQDGSSATYQRMSTYTLGLGVDGTLRYTKDYKEATTGDFADIVADTKKWPDPTTSTASDEKIDDLWHAAVNGEGRYFSAKNPNDVTQGLADALTSIATVKLSGAASGYSDKQLLSVDNFAYRATYITDQWTGNVEKRKIDPATGATSDFIDNCAENILAAPPSNACTGANTAPAITSASADTRSIYINAGGLLVPFTYANLSDIQKPFFESSFLSTHLSQWTVLTADQKTAAEKAGIVNFLRGQTGLEDRSGNLTGLTDNRIFRFRKAVLGDIVDSEPVFVGKPPKNYTDAGYEAFKSARAGRAGRIYVGANDGMLHALDANTLAESWAFVPSAVLPKMWYLADRSYNHENYVNATVTVADVFIGGAWKTILVGGFNGGARGYYALDITDPSSPPQLLWEFTDDNMGYTFGKPKVVKTQSGKWVVLLTSGYNNRPDFLKSTGNGGGYLYVVDAAAGTTINTYSTGEGTEAAPSGLANISAVLNDVSEDATSSLVYGGDLAGNLWRFDISSGPSGSNPLLFAKLKDSAGVAQPITTAPEVGIANGKRIVFVSTGKYLEPDDRSTTQTQTIYGIRDNNETTTLSSPRSVLIQQTFSGSGSTRNTSNNAVDSADRGWYIDLPDSGERQYIDSKLFGGVLVAITNVPTGTECSPSGYAWLNLINYKTGASVPTNLGVAGVAGSLKLDNGGVGAAIIGNGSDIVISVDTGKGSQVVKPPKIGSLNFQNKRSIWRELTK